MGARAVLHTSYSTANVVLYNATTIVHYLLGGAGIIIAYSSRPLTAWVTGVTYVLLALVQMYVLMPLAVCPACVYHRLEGSRCVSGLSAVSRLLAPSRPEATFRRRGEGAACPNNLYLAALLLPIVAIVPALVLTHSARLALVLGALVLLLLFRFLVLFPKIACLHCLAKHVCPQAGAMGVRER